jgi:phosphoglycolate phosphatase-like HAD superfamily hydrolase
MRLSPEVSARVLLQGARVVFWDFDGVIKDSVAAKSVGFEQLFLPYGLQVAHEVRRHHEAHGGVSRFDKMPIYLEWAGEPVTPARVQEFCARFSQLVLQAVIDSPWVPGVPEYLRTHQGDQLFVLMSATPQAEIEHILAALNIADCFHTVYGAPTPKSTAIREMLECLPCAPERALAVGDAETDFHAAEANRVPFLLRRTAINQTFQHRYTGPAFEDLNTAAA